MKTLPYHVALCSLMVLGRTTCPAQSCDSYVASGRAFLAAQDLGHANASFSNAVALCPNHATGNVFYAATRLLTLADRPAGKSFLDRLGFAPTNRSIYDWTAVLPRDANNVVLVPTNMSASE